jgi:hypothetical protein
MTDVVALGSRDQQHVLACLIMVMLHAPIKAAAVRTERFAPTPDVGAQPTADTSQPVVSL